MDCDRQAAGARQVALAAQPGAGRGSVRRWRLACRSRILFEQVVTGLHGRPTVGIAPIMFDTPL